MVVRVARDGSPFLAKMNGEVVLSLVMWSLGVNKGECDADGKFTGAGVGTREIGEHIRENR
jgi:hypothetical protein